MYILKITESTYSHKNLDTYIHSAKNVETATKKWEQQPKYTSINE